ncbi:MAG: GNAT family N-acetyltransferase [Candidatus Eisenbacteria bacterium]
MTPAAVRPAEARDLARIWELLHGLAEYERMTELITGSREAFGNALFGSHPVAESLVAESSGVIVGYALFYPTFSSFRTRTMLWLEDLFVDPAARGSGAGKALLMGLARLALARGCYRVDWHVLEWNLPAIGFYEHMGASRQEADCMQYGLAETELRQLAGESC